MPDRAVAVKNIALDRIAVLGYDGTLAVINNRGKIEWQQLLDTGHAMNHRMDVASNGSLIAVAARNGLLAFDAKGNKRFEALRPGPQILGHPIPRVTFVAVSPDGTRIAEGAPDGKIIVSDNMGKMLWSAAGWTHASSFYFQDAIFSSDGNELVTLSDKQATALKSSDGTLIGQVNGADCRFAPLRLGKNLLINDGKNNLTLFAPVTATVVSALSLPGVAVALEVSNGSLLVGNETDGSVQQMKAITGKSVEQLEWKYIVPQRLVKQIASGPAIAVSYWGGTVHIIDGSGKLIAQRTFEQDIVRLAWLNDLLVVSLADGRLLALRIK